MWSVVLFLRATTAIAVALAGLVTLLTVIGVALVATSAIHVADGVAVRSIALGWALASLGLLSVARLAFLGAQALIRRHGVAAPRDGRDET